jgi:hypothetical protein
LETFAGVEAAGTGVDLEGPELEALGGFEFSVGKEFFA